MLEGTASSDRDNDGKEAEKAARPFETPKTYVGGGVSPTSGEKEVEGACCKLPPIEKPLLRSDFVCSACCRSSRLRC